MGDESKTVRVPRAWVFMVIGAAVLGAALASVFMVNWLVPRLSKNEAARSLPVQNAPANEHPANRQDAPASTPPQPPPIKRPIPTDDGTPPKEVPPPPPPPEDPPVQRDIFVVELDAGAAFKIKPPGGAWSEGAATSALSEGTRLRVSSGRVTIEFWKSRVIALAGCDFTLEKKPEHALTLNDGGLLLDGSRAQGPVTLNLPQQAIVLEGAIVAALAAPVSSLLEMTSGRAKFGEQEASGREAPQTIVFGAAIEKRVLGHQRAAEIENSFRSARDVLLAWDFEGKQLPCTLGKRLSPGFRDSQGALVTAPEFAALGDETGTIFKCDETTCLRLRVKTNARYVRISFVAGPGRLGETWSYMLLTPERDGWALCEVPLTAFSKPFKEARALPGQSCHSLQFRMRFDDNDPTLPSERYLVIDDVEIFTPK